MKSVGGADLRASSRNRTNMSDHDAALISNWNSHVSPEDEIWHLGDFSVKRAGFAKELLSQLHGDKHLIVGNNDPAETTSAAGWASVQHYAELTLDGRRLFLCHYPFRTWNQMGKASINLHGHSHGRLNPMPRQFDVGVDPCGLRPITLTDLQTKRSRGAPGKDAA